MTNNFIENQEESEDEIILRFIKMILSDVNTVLPCKVVSYDKNTKFAEVQPLHKESFKQANDEEIIKERAIISNVPILFMRGGGFCQKFPIPKNTIGILFASQRSIDDYLETDGKTFIEPIEDRFHDIQDSFFLPAMITKKNTIEENSDDCYYIGTENGTDFIKIKVDSIEVKTKDFIVNANEKTIINSPITKVGGDSANIALAKATVTNTNFNNLNVWVTAVNTALNALGITLPSPSISSVDSNKIKVTD